MKRRRLATAAPAAMQLPTEVWAHVAHHALGNVVRGLVPEAELVDRARQPLPRAWLATALGDAYPGDRVAEHVRALLCDPDAPRCGFATAAMHARAVLRHLAARVRDLGALACASRAHCAAVRPLWPRIAAVLVRPALTLLPHALRYARTGGLRCVRAHYDPGPPWRSTAPGRAPRPPAPPPCARYTPAYARAALALALETATRDALSAHVPTRAIASDGALQAAADAYRADARRYAATESNPRLAVDDARRGRLVAPFVLYAPRAAAEQARVARWRAASGRGRHTYGARMGEDAPNAPLAEPDAVHALPPAGTPLPAGAVPLAVVSPERLAVRPLTAHTHLVPIEGWTLPQLRARLAVDARASHAQTRRLRRLPRLCAAQRRADPGLPRVCSCQQHGQKGKRRK